VLFGSAQSRHCQNGNRLNERTTHADHYFSVRVRTANLAAAYCLRAIADFAQQTGNSRIAWGGTTDDSWKQSGGIMTFYFSAEKYRGGFLEAASRLLPQNSWHEDSQPDSVAATPRSR
jgi:hypothetical protein